MPNFQGDSCSYLTYSLHPHSPYLDYIPWNKLILVYFLYHEYSLLHTAQQNLKFNFAENILHFKRKTVFLQP